MVLTASIKKYQRLYWAKTFNNLDVDTQGKGLIMRINCTIGNTEQNNNASNENRCPSIPHRNHHIADSL